MHQQSRCPLLVALVIVAMTLSFSPQTYADAGANDPEYVNCVMRCGSSAAGGAYNPEYGKCVTGCVNAADAGAYDGIGDCVNGCVNSECEGAGGACGQGSSYDCEHDQSVHDRCVVRCKDKDSSPNR